MPLDNLLSAVRQAESANRDYDEKGNPVVSPKGARYAMQVMPSTAANPGYGIQPAKDDSPEEYNRVGREYLQALQQQYGGDLELALAAYNAGPGNVDAALKQGREGFLDRLPKPEETKPYVQKIMGRLGGPSSAQVATSTDVDAALARLNQRILGAPIADEALSRLATVKAEFDKKSDVDSALGKTMLTYERAKQLGGVSNSMLSDEEPEEPGFVSSLVKDLAVWGTAGAAATSLVASAGISSPIAVPLLTGIFVTGMQGVDKLFNPEVDNQSISGAVVEGLTGEKPSEAVESIYEVGENIIFAHPATGKALWKVAKGSVKLAGRGTGKVIRGFDLAFHKPVSWIGSKIEPVGQKLWDNILVKTSHLPIPGTGKNIREMVQPGVERLAQDSSVIAQRAAQVFTRSNAQKALTTEAGRRLQEEMKNLAPTAVYDVLKGLRGTPYGQLKSTEAKEILGRFDSYMKEVDLNGLYERKFRESLSKGLTKPIAAIEDTVPYSDVNNFLGLFETNLPQKHKAKDVHRILDEIMTHPSASPEMQQFAKDLWSAPAQTPLEVARASRQASTAYLTNKLLSVPGLVTGAAQPGYIQSNWRRFKGAYLPRDMELELQAIDQVPKIAEGTYQKFFLGPFKASATVMRPSFHVGQTIGNLVLNDWGGLPFWRADVYAKALKEMRSGGALWKEYRNLTGATRGGSWAQSDLYQLEAGMKHGANMIDKMYNIYQSAVRPGSRLAVAETNWSRFAKYLHNLEKGLTPIESAMESGKWIFDFAGTTPEVAKLSKYAVPFARWQTRILPLMAETATKHPLRFFKWLAFAQAVQAYGLDQTGMSEEEWESVSKTLPNYLQSGMFLLMPWRDEQGRLNLLNGANLIPGFAQVTDFYSRSPAESVIQNPFVTLASTLLSKKKFSEAPLYYEWEEPSVKFMKSMSYAWESFAPSMLPGGVDWNKLYKSFTEQEDALSPEAAMASVFGLRMTAVDEVKAARRKEAVRRIHASELNSQMQKELRNAKSDKETQRVLDRYQKLKMEVMAP